MKQKKKSCRLKQHQSRNLLIVSLMKETGWTRDRAVSAIEELEKSQLIYFPEAGGLGLQVVGGF